MEKRKRKTRWIWGGLGILIALLLVVLLVLPKLINLEPVKEKLLAQASKAVGGQVECQRVELSFLPIPRVVVQRLFFLSFGTDNLRLQKLSQNQI